jgi:hypothetical protein
MPVGIICVIGTFLTDKKIKLCGSFWE